ncbi:hypothetical protein ACLB0R_03395 [Sphingomonas sp. GlSt437]|uniref:hypothetical protein n=1 Tax=Sphingomonas sp. GlSt437 TaxID=3389970 RepID=UPI003A8A08DB
MPQRLDGYFAKIEASMVEADALLATRDPALSNRIRQKCVDAGVLVSAYQLFVHRELFEPLMRDGDAYQRKLACELKAECIALTDALRTAIKNFMAQELPFDWNSLAERIQHHNRIMRAHIARVRTLLATLAPATKAA